MAPFCLFSKMAAFIESQKLYTVMSLWLFRALSDRVDTVSSYRKFKNFVTENEFPWKKEIREFLGWRSREMRSKSTNDRHFFPLSSTKKFVENHSKLCAPSTFPSYSSALDSVGRAKGRRRECRCRWKRMRWRFVRQGSKLARVFVAFIYAFLVQEAARFGIWWRTFRCQFVSGRGRGHEFHAVLHSKIW